MKVLHVLNELKPSGAESMLLSAAPRWLAASTQHILSTGAVAGSFAGPLQDAGYCVIHLPFGKSLGFFRQFGALLRRERYDVVHLHTEKAALWYALAARLSMGRQVALVRTVHHLFRFDGLLRVRRKSGRQVMRHLLGVRFLSNSPSGHNNEATRYAMTNELAPNWYDSAHFHPPAPHDRTAARLQLGFGHRQVVFVSLGGNWAYKNYDHVVSALAMVPADLDVLYVQIGVQGEGAPLERLAAELHVTHRLRCAGVVADALPYLHGADAYVMPSSEEGFGVAAVEAMACGLPALLSNKPALCDFKQNLPGISFVNPDVGEIAAAMERLARMTDIQRRALGATQAAGVLRHYGLDVGPVCYLNVWHEESAKRPAPAGQ